MAVVVILALFSSSILCLVLAYNQWSGAVVKVHRGLEGPQKTYIRLSDEETDRMYAMVAGAIGSALLGTGLFVGLSGHVFGRK